MSRDQVKAVKARLAPWLDEPYFKVVRRWETLTMKQCDHRNHGVRLIETDRQAICNGCGKPVDAFDALLHYAESEQRLLSTRQAIEQAHKAEAERKQRDKERRPFAREVVSWTERKDLTLKAEPVTGYNLKLECGHAASCGPNRRVRRVTCRECEHIAKKAAKEAR